MLRLDLAMIGSRLSRRRCGIHGQLAAFIVVLMASAPLCGAAEPAAPDDCPEGGSEERSVPNRVLVKRRPGLAALDFELQSTVLAKVVSVRSVGTTGVQRIESSSLSTDELLKIFRSDPERWKLAWAEPDAYIEAHARVEPDDPEFANMQRSWGWDAVRAPEAWSYGTGSMGVTVAVVDSGLCSWHSDLDQRIDPVFGLQGTDALAGPDCQAGDFGFDAVDGDCRPEDLTHHGTWVAGVIGAEGNNCVGITGVAWEVSLLPVRTLDQRNRGCVSRAIRALEFVRRMKEQDRPIRVVNLSWGTSVRSQALEDELKKLAARNVLIVASAGNGGYDNDFGPVYPAGYDIDTLISVAATDRDRMLLGRSNCGRNSVDIAAPGDRVFTTRAPEDRTDFEYDYASYTSIAAPFVSGAAALLASQCPGLSAVELRRLILEEADRLPELEPYVEEGRFLDIEAAAQACAAWRAAVGGL